MRGTGKRKSGYGSKGGGIEDAGKMIAVLGQRDEAREATGTRECSYGAYGKGAGGEEMLC